MRVVIDTNILLQAIGHNSPFRPIWEAFLEGSLELLITPGILLEYEEIIAARTSQVVAANIVSLICEAANVHRIDVFYAWNAITADPDDNKFFDAAVAGNADCIVTNDAHFRHVTDLEFPRMAIMSGQDLLAIVNMGL